MLIGPAPCFFARVAGQSRWHIVVRADDPAALLRDFPIPSNWRIDIDPINML
jgi:primosomal protein N' (replication factor Y)